MDSYYIGHHGMSPCHFLASYLSRSPVPLTRIQGPAEPPEEGCCPCTPCLATDIPYHYLQILVCAFVPLSWMPFLPCLPSNLFRSFPLPPKQSRAPPLAPTASRASPYPGIYTVQLYLPGYRPLSLSSYSPESPPGTRCRHFCIPGPCTRRGYGWCLEAGHRDGEYTVHPCGPTRLPF